MKKTLIIIFVIATIIIPLKADKISKINKECIYFVIESITGIKIKKIDMPKPKVMDETTELRADAGEDINACRSTRINLSGSNSIDPLNMVAVLTYEWYFYEKPLNSRAFLWAWDTETPFFYVDKEGEYYVTLIVTHADGRTASDTVCIVAKDCGVYPVGDIQHEPFTCEIPKIIELDGSRSYVNGDDEIIYYDWAIVSKPSGSQTILLSQNMETNTIRIDEEGIYRIKLSVQTSLGYRSEPVYAIIQAKLGDPPIIKDQISRYRIEAFKIKKDFIHLEYSLLNRTGCFQKPVHFELYKSVNNLEYEFIKKFKEDEIYVKDNESYFDHKDKYYQCGDDVEYLLLGFDINNKVIIEKVTKSKGY